MSQDELEKRRLKAADYFRAGKANNWICRKLGVSHGSVTEWHVKWKDGGRDALKQGKYGRISKMSPKDERKVQRHILKCAKACGYDTDYWTLRRLTDYITKETKISYKDRSVWHTMERFGFSCQKPERRARERDEKAISTWIKTTWPAVKKRASETRPHLAFSTSPE
jgi:transposase